MKKPDGAGEMPVCRPDPQRASGHRPMIVKKNRQFDGTKSILLRFDDSRQLRKTGFTRFEI
ncbi:hypothetical protein [Roseibium sp.]|uniref:hypothetical protein n=1 Tax=Roseibium sp. TaxID=1936156 RepID=UPI003A977AB2